MNPGNMMGMEVVSTVIQDIEEKIREVAAALLNEGRVEKVLGYARGTLQGRVVPVEVTDPGEVGMLVWNSFCDINLARYVAKHDKDHNVGVVAKGCVGRALVQLILENQLYRDSLHVIGVNCAGMIDRRRIQREMGAMELVSIVENGDEVVAEAGGVKKSFPRDEYLNQLCKVCTHPVPPVWDSLVGGETGKPALHEDFTDVREFEQKSPDEKWAYFTDILQNCIRCYACREACPMCYCSYCFVDQNMPVWFGKTPNTSDNVIFHAVRALHLAGRCVACGDCNTVCPTGVDLVPLTRLIQKSAFERFNFEAGVDLERIPPLSDYSANDQEEFMEGEY
ncbi:MAG: 4Fe-4S ferredoxin [Promethearchaeota archaeon]